MPPMIGSSPKPSPRRPRPAAPIAPPHAPAAALGERELHELQDWLDRVPAPLEPLDVSMLDGYLCGVLLQPLRVPVSRWLPHVTDADGRPLPARFDAARLQSLVLRRHAELDAAIAGRLWFDPWVFELTDDDDGAPVDPASGKFAARDDDHDDHHDAEHDSVDDAPAAVDAVYPWVAGFAHALETFPGLMALDARALLEPLALVYRHLDADDLEDADELLAEIESMEPPQDLADAVEGLVRATLLFADVSRPVPVAPVASPTRRPAAPPQRPVRGRGPSKR